MSRRTGQQQEAEAERFLNQQGLTLIARNYFCPRGEIDLIMRDRDCVVFVEVRYRRSRSFASAAESVDWRKQQRLAATAEHFLQQHPALRNQPCRFDVIAANGSAEPEWIKNAFDA